MLINVISGLGIYKPQMISAQPANTGNTPDVANALKKVVISLDYPESTAQAFANEVMSWKDASGRQLMKGWKEALDKARNEHKAEKIGLAELVNIETKIINELGNRIKKEFRYNEEMIELTKVLISRQAQCETYTEMVHAIASAMGFPLQGVNVSKMSIPMPKGKAHIICLIGTTDKQMILIDLAREPSIVVTTPFNLDTRFKKDGNYLALKSGPYAKNDIGIFKRIQLLDLNGLIASRYSNQSNFCSDSGDFQQAITILNKSISLNPMFALAYNNRGLAYTNLGQHKQAIADYDKAISIDPECSYFYYNRGITNVKLRKPAQAIADNEKALSIDPNNSDAYYNRQLFKEFSSVYIFRGNTYMDSSKYEQAIAYFDTAISIDPKYAVAYYSRGIATLNFIMDTKDMSRAQSIIDDLQKAGELDPALLPEIQKVYDKIKDK